MGNTFSHILSFQLQIMYLHQSSISNWSICYILRTTRGFVYPSRDVSEGSMLVLETSSRAGAAVRDTSTCTRDQLCRILGGLNQALHVCIQPSWVILSFFSYTRWFLHIVGSSLGSMTQTKYRVGDEKESNRAKQRWSFRGKRRRRNESAGRILLIFSNIWSDKDEMEKKDGQKISEEGQREVAERARDEKSVRSFLFFSFPVAFGGDFSVSYLCCHGNSLDSRGERTSNSERGKTDEGKEGEGVRKEKLVPYIRGRVPLFQILSALLGIRDNWRAAKTQTDMMEYDSTSSFRSVGS